MFDSVTSLFTSVFRNQPGGEKVFHPTQTCPECGSKLCAEKGTEDWRCPNPDCSAQVRTTLTHWCSPGAMDIAGGDATMVAKLVGKGLARDVAELYRLKVAEVAALDGMDKDSAQKFFDAITGSLKRDAWQLVSGLGIPTVSAGEAKALGRGFPTVDAVFAAGVERLVKEAGISETVAQNIVIWHGDPVNQRLIERLRKAGLNFKSAIHNPKSSQAA